MNPVLHLVLLLAIPSFISATFSIVATDKETRQVGGAGATCLDDEDVHKALYFSIPNKGVLHRQGDICCDDSIPLAGLEAMGMNASVDDVLNTMLTMDNETFTFDEFDDDYYLPPGAEDYETEQRNLRQYAIADFDSHIGYTGSSLYTIYHDIFGFPGSTEQTHSGGEATSSRYVYHAAGNIVKEGTVQSLQNGFLTEEDNDVYGFGLCDMAGKLMNAMYHLLKDGNGDSRCLLQYGTTAASGFLHIDNADGTEYIHINAIDDGTKEPLEKLKRKFMRWRRKNPCKVCEPNEDKNARFFIGMKTKANGESKPKMKRCGFISKANKDRLCSMTEGYGSMKPAREVCTGKCNSC